VFSASTVSQGSLLMHIKCGEMFNNHSAANLLQNLPVKKFENQLRTGGVSHEIGVSLFGTRYKEHHTNTNAASTIM